MDCNVSLPQGKGRIEQIGTPSEVYRNPETAFTASFFGQPSIFGDYSRFHTFEEVEGAENAIVRPEFVKVRAQNRKGQWCMFKGEGLKARCFCHEIDHLDGIVFTDRAKRMLTDEELRRLNKEE